MCLSALVCRFIDYFILPLADYLLTCSLINAQARLDILKIHSRKMNLTRGINLKKIADQLSHASGAEIKGTFIFLAVEFYYFVLYYFYFVTRLCVI